MFSALQLSVLLLGFIWCLYRRWTKSPLANLPLPPGPRPLPIIGNLLDVRASFIWEMYHKWSKELNSDIIHINAAGTSIVVLNSYEAAVELLEKRSNIHSSRVRLPMLNELMGWDYNFGFMPYNDRWRYCRRLFHQSFNERASREFHPQLTKAAHQLLVRLINRPMCDVIQQLRTTAGAMVLGIAYGIPVLPEKDTHITLAEEVTHAGSVALVPGTFLVDQIPWLKYVPAWFPGASFQRKAKEWKILNRHMIEMPYMASKKLIDEGVHTVSFVSRSLAKLDHSEKWDEGVIQDVAAVMFSAGVHTTASAMATFVYAMLKHPDIQRRAQEELDRVVECGHLPTLQDEESLPYTTVIVKEVLRWRPVAPIGIPHCSTTEDIYKGYRIPAGSIVIGNAWAISYDENLYPEPETFNPDRFMKDGKLDTDVLDSTLVAFGFGRRICPGRYMAWSSLWITIASILATTSIIKAVDENGVVIEPSGKYESALVYTLEPFACSIKPRSKEAEELIQLIALDKV